MKCILLAGGSGDRMWPLSRKNNPKQFVALKEGHSLFQEAVVRNMPFCREFLVITSAACRNIVEGQMQPFQQLRWRCLCEAEPRKTAPAVGLAALLSAPDEVLVLVSTDHFIEGDYKSALTAAQALAEQGRLACLGVKPRAAGGEELSFLAENGRGGLEYRFAQTAGQAAELAAEGRWLWDTGILLGRAECFVAELDRYAPDLMAALRAMAARLPDGPGPMVDLPPYSEWNVPALSLGPALTRRSERMSLVRAEFSWTRMISLQSLQEYYRGNVGPQLQQDCENVSVLNFAPGNLVVAGGLRDLLVVNTADAVYVTPKSRAGQIKQIIRDRHEYDSFFAYSPVDYAEWGLKERLGAGRDYIVRRLTVFPGREMREEELTAEATRRWTILAGTACVTENGCTRTCVRGESVQLLPGGRYALYNGGEENVMVLDLYTGSTEKSGGQGSLQSLPVLADAGQACEPLLKLSPAFKDNLWGGRQLRSVYGKKADCDPVAESWELSAHPAGPCTLASGKWAGMSFCEYLRRAGKQALGWKCQSLDRFPLLIKFIDALQDLSIQVHPDDEYALHNENEFGKNEMWYILNARPGACLYCGFERPVSREEIGRRVQEGTLMEVMHRIPVQAGQTVFIPSGTVHAIGAGILLCEVQQSSNVTYRLYDYGRLDKDKKPRALHLKQALEVLDPALNGSPQSAQSLPEGELLCACKYFSVMRVTVEDSALLHLDDSSFTALVVLEGSGTVSVQDVCLPFGALDTFFVPAGRRTVQLRGRGVVLKVQV